MSQEKVLLITRFVISGGLATATNLAVLAVLVHALHVWYVPASAFAFLVAFGVSFTLQKFWTFGDDRTHLLRRQAIIYFCIVLCNLVINTALVYAFVEYLRFMPLIAQALASLIVAFESFFAYRFLVFKE